jgi:hypothetical protein
MANAYLTMPTDMNVSGINGNGARYQPPASTTVMVWDRDTVADWRKIFGATALPTMFRLCRCESCGDELEVDVFRPGATHGCGGFLQVIP